MKPFFNRELSWLAFNARVLYQASRADVPLLERVKFLAITASNLDEFFQVRVGGLKMMIKAGRNQPDPSGLSPRAQLAEIRKRVCDFMDKQYHLWHGGLVKLLEKNAIRFKEVNQLDETQIALLRAYFEQHIFPALTPFAVQESEAVNLPALVPIVACQVKQPDGEKRYIFIPLPEQLNRFVPMGQESGTYILLEDIVSSFASAFLSDGIVMHTTTFRITRNSDIAVDEDQIADLADEMADVIAARRVAETVRLELPASCVRELSLVIRSVTQVNKDDVYLVPRAPVGMNAVMEIACLKAKSDLHDEDWQPQFSPAINAGESIFTAISRGDILLHHPYQSFDPVLQLLEEAANDADVIAIKQVLYRTAKKSRVIDALIQAAQNGKQVTVLVELKARFDEARNLLRADELQNAGVQIVYGVKGFKTHAKILMIVRREGTALKRYMHFGTGNYNESTAKLYTDLSLLTCKPELANDASLFFNSLTGRSKVLRFQKLFPSPISMKEHLINMIRMEAERAKSGESAWIKVKINSLQDTEIIHALYQASQAGVKIRLNVRGVCCLIAGDKKYSKNIRVISIIDRYLEHARIIAFCNGGDEKVFISSADWMSRNLDRRIELMIPLEDPKIKKRTIRILDNLFSDNQNAHLLLVNGSYQKLPTPKGQKPYRAQLEFFRDAKKIARAKEHQKAMTFEPHTPPK